MSEKNWQHAVEINPDDLTPVEKATHIAPQEFPEEQVSAVEEEGEYIPADSDIKNRGYAFGKWFAAFILGLLALGVGVEFYRLISWGFGIHNLLGITLSTLLGAGVGTGLLWVAHAFKGLRQLEKNDALREEAERFRNATTHGQAVPYLKKLDKVYNGTAAGESIHQAIQQIDSVYNDGEVIRFVSRNALVQQDEAARRCVRRYSIQSGLMVAISPYASFDMWLVGWRNLKMLNEIANIYGIAPGAATQWRLLRKVLHNIAFAGISEMSIHASSHFLSNSLASSLSMKAGQGVGAGLFTARSGLQALKLCRPLPVEEDDGLQLSSIAKAIMQDLKEPAPTPAKQPDKKS